MSGHATLVDPAAESAGLEAFKPLQIAQSCSKSQRVADELVADDLFIAAVLTKG